MELTPGTDYTFTAVPMTSVSGGDFSITGNGNFTGTYTGTWDINPASAEDLVTFTADDAEFTGLAYSEDKLSVTDGFNAFYEYYDFEKATDHYCGTKFSRGKWLNIGVNYKASDIIRSYIKLSEICLYYDPECTQACSAGLVMTEFKLNPDNSVIVKDSYGDVETLYSKPGTSFAVDTTDWDNSSTIMLRPQNNTTEIRQFLDTVKMNGAPVTAGNYLVKAFISNPNYVQVIRYDTFTITKKPVTLTMKYSSTFYGVHKNSSFTDEIDNVLGDVAGYRINRNGLVKVMNGDTALEANAYAPAGTYTYVINDEAAAKGNNANYTFSFTNDQLVISAFDLSNTSSSIITYTDASDCDNTYTYDGESKYLGFTLKNSHTGDLVKNTDYTVTYKKGGEVVASPTDVGEYTVEITGKAGGNYTGTMTKTMTINPFELTAGDVKLTVAGVETNNTTYTGSNVAPDITVTADLDGDGIRETELVKDEDYTVYYICNDENVDSIVDVGTYHIQIFADGNYDGIDNDVIFKVNKADQQVTVTPNEHIIYDGAAVDASDFTVTSTCTSTGDQMGAVTLEFYSAANDNSKLDAAPKDAGEYYVKATVAATANYWGGDSGFVRFNIAKKEVTVTLGHEDITWGKLVSKTELFTAAEGGFIEDDESAPSDAVLAGLFTAKLDNTDFNFTDGSQNAVGTYTLAVIEANLNYYNTQPNNYTLTVTGGSFKIIPRSINDSAWVNVNVPFDEFSFDGSLKRPSVSVQVWYETANGSGVLNDTAYFITKGNKAASDIGNYSLRVIGKGILTGTYEDPVTEKNYVAWSIVAGDMRYSSSDPNFNFETFISSLHKTYDGTEVDVETALTDSNGAVKLKLYDNYSNTAVSEDLDPEINVVYCKKNGSEWEPFDGIPKDAGSYKAFVTATAEGYNAITKENADDRYYCGVFTISPATLTVTINAEDLEKAKGYSEYQAGYTVAGWVEGEESLFTLPAAVTIPAGLANGDNIPGTVLDPLTQALAEKTGNYRFTLSDATITLHEARLVKVEARTALLKGDDWIDVDGYLTAYDENGAEIAVDDDFFEKYYIDGTDSANKVGTYDVIIKDIETDEELASCKWIVRDTLIAGHTLNLADVIGVNFYVDFTGLTVDENTYVVLTNNRSGEVRIDASKGAVSGAYHIYTIPVAPAELSDTITCDVYVGGELWCSEEYKARQYCETMISREAVNQFQINRKNTCIALLNYAAAAQTFFNYNTEDMANKYLTDNNITYTKSESVVDFDEILTDAHTKYWTAEEKAALLSSHGIRDIEYKGTALNVDASVSVRHVFEVKTGTVERAIKKYKKRITFNGANIKRTIEKLNDTQFVVATSGIDAVDLYKSDLCGFSISGTVILDEYSVCTYARSYKERGTASAQKKVDLVEAMYYYSCEANNMFS